MTPRRKADQPEGEAEAPKHAPSRAEGKKRAPRKKAAPVETEPPELTSAAASAPKLDAIPKAPTFGLPPLKTSEPLPVNASAPKSIPIRTEPPKLTIEPDARYVPSVAGEPQSPDRWTPSRKDDQDLSMPPRILLQSKRVAQEVEDILEEPEDTDGEPKLLLHPPIRTGLYRKLGIGFAALALIVAGLIGYMSYSRATVVVHPKLVTLETKLGIDVVENPSGATEIAGEVQEVTVAGEETMEPGGEVDKEEAAPVEAPKVDENAIYTGTVTLYNKTASPITLVPTTRLLTPDGVLFRMKARVTVQANKTASAEVYADKPGSTGNIGPSDFTIPGLPENVQSVIYAKSESAMTADGKTQTPNPKPQTLGTVVKAEEIENLEKVLREQLVAQAKEEITKKIKGTWTGDSYVVEVMSRFVNVAPGESTDKIVVRLTLRVRSVSFDRAKALEVAVADLKRSLTSDRDLATVKGDEAEVTIDRAEPKSSTAHITVALKAESSVSLSNPLFDADKLKGLDLAAVRTYFEGIEGVDRVDVRFRPFWLKRMPGLKNHIEFKIEP